MAGADQEPGEPGPAGPGAGGQATMRLGEFVPMAALMMSLVAMSIDAMLPALPAIGADLGVANANDTQLIVSTLILGLGVGQLLSGPLSDSLGRKPVICGGYALFMAGSVACALADAFPAVLAGRFLQGLGAAAPRIVMLALVRDQYEGRAMARVMSFVMAVFILVPMIAPAAGQGILLVAGWRAIFVGFLLMALVALAWFAARQPETLPAARRAPLSARRVARAVAEVCTTRVVLGYIVATGLVFAPFIGYLGSAQQIFQDTYGVGAMFPAYFALLALAIGTAAVVNGRLVMRHGMRRLCRWAAGMLAVIAGFLFAVAWASGGAPPLWLFVAGFLAAFFCVGVLFGNLNALAMHPLGHIAGVGAAVVGSLSTFISVPLGALVARGYDGSVLPLTAGFGVLGAAALGAMLWADAGAPTRVPGR